MATEQTIRLELTIETEDHIGNVTITPLKQRYTVPVAREAIDGIEERIAQINTLIPTVRETPPTDSSPTVNKYAYGIATSKLFVPDQQYGYEFASLNKIVEAKMVIVETENIYDYRNT